MCHARGAAQPTRCRKADVIDLTSRMRAGRHARLDASAGRWTVLRIGYSLTAGRTARVARGHGPRGGQAHAAHVKAYFDDYLDMYKDATGR